MTTIQDRIQTLKNILFANGVKCDSEQFLIEDINNLIKEVEEETRKETAWSFASFLAIKGIESAKMLDYYNDFLSITNKEKQKMKTTDILKMSQEISNNIVKQWVLDKECIKNCYECKHLNKENKECDISLKQK